MQQDVYKGQAVYSKLVLKVYDLWVLGFSNTFLWRCPTSVLEQQFVHFATDNHLDIGVGTGYYPDKCFEAEQRRLALLDLNPNSLEVTASRVQRFKPEIYQANILEPLTLKCDKFDSVSINFLLHCLPGTMAEKLVLLKYIQPYLNPAAVVFGSTILGRGVELNAAARKLMSVYNNKGIFCNSQDDLVQLQQGLEQHFQDVNIRVEGCVAVFSARY